MPDSLENDCIQYSLEIIMKNIIKHFGAFNYELLANVRCVSLLFLILVLTFSVQLVLHCLSYRHKIMKIEYAKTVKLSK